MFAQFSMKGVDVFLNINLMREIQPASIGGSIVIWDNSGRTLVDQPMEYVKTVLGSTVGVAVPQVVATGEKKQ